MVLSGNIGEAVPFLFLFLFIVVWSCIIQCVVLSNSHKRSAK